MTLTQRRIFLIVLVVVFIIAAPLVILYSSGYQIDWKTWRLQKTGGIYINAYPKGASISVDGVQKEIISTLFLSQGKLISGLIPGTHDVKVEKSGFTPWEKNLEVKPNLVTEARNIFLAPINKKESVVVDGINDFIVSDSQALIAYSQKNTITILDLASGAANVIPQHAGESIGKISFGSDENHLIIESFLKNKVRKYVTNVKTGAITDIPEDEADKYVVLRQYPSGQEKLAALSSRNTLYTIDLASPNAKTETARNVSTFELFDTKLIYATLAPTILYEKDLVSGETVQITQSPIDNFDSSARILRSGDGHLAIIDNKKTLYLYDDVNAVFNLVARNIIKASFSPDKKKLLYQNRNELYVKYLRDILIQPYKKIGDVDFITRFSQPIQNSEWFSYDNEHILFATEGKLKLVELDDRDERNTQDISAVRSPLKIKYNSYDDYIYFLDGTTLKKISLLENK